MRLRVQINRTPAIRRGYDAPSQTVGLEVDPGILTIDERTIVTSCLAAGFNLSGYCTTRFRASRDPTDSN